MALQEVPQPLSILADALSRTEPRISWAEVKREFVRRGGETDPRTLDRWKAGTTRPRAENHSGWNLLAAILNKRLTDGLVPTFPSFEVVGETPASLPRPSGHLRIVA